MTEKINRHSSIRSLCSHHLQEMDVNNSVDNAETNTVLFEDTVVVDDLGDDVPGFTDCEQNARTQIVDECEEEVVLDSDDEGARRADVRGEASWDVDFVPDSDGSDGEQGGLVVSHEKLRPLHGCSRRASALVPPKMVSKPDEVQSIPLWTHARTKKQIGLKDEEISKLRKQYLVVDIVPMDPKDRDRVEDQLVDSNNNSSSYGGSGTSDRRNSTRLDYVGYEEPGESPEAKALKFVDHFVSSNNVDLFERGEPRESVRKSPPPSSSKGFQSLAKRIHVIASTRETECFEWTEGHHDVVAASSSKKNGVLVDGRDRLLRSVTGTSKSRRLGSSKRGHSVHKFEEEKGSPKEVGHLGKKVDAESTKEQAETCGGGNGMQDDFDGVFNTQMAAEVMETLLYVPPAELSFEFSFQNPQSTSSNGSSRGLTKNMVPKPSDDKLAARKNNKTNPPADRLEKATQISGQRIRLNDDLTIRSKKEGDAIVKSSGSSSNVWKASVVRSCSSTSTVERNCCKSKNIKSGEFALSSMFVDHIPAEKPSGTVCEPWLSTSLSSLDTMKNSSIPLDEKTSDIMQCGFSTYKRKRQLTSLSSMEGIGDLPIAYEETTSNVLQKGFCTYRRKRSTVLNGRGEHPNSIFRAGKLASSIPSEMMKDLPVTCGEKSGILVQSPFLTDEGRGLTSLSSLENMKNLPVTSEETKSDAMQHGFRAFTRKRSSLLSGRTRRRDCPNSSSALGEARKVPPEEAGNDVKQHGFRTYTRKRSSLLSGRKCCLNSSSVLGDARNSKSSEEQANGATASPVTSVVLNTWSYPKGKRSLRAKKQFRPCSLTDGNGSPSGNVLTTCFSLEMKGKSKSSDVRNKDTTLINICSTDAYIQSTKLDNFDPISGDNGEKQNSETLPVVPESKLFGSECTATSSGKGDKLAATSYTDKGDHRQPCKSNQPRIPLVRELIQLGVPDLFSDSSTKDLRRRRSMANIRVLFSQHLDDDIVKQQKKVLARIGISLASCSADATHFITDRFVRTKNMLEAIALGKSILSYLWLESCGQANWLIDEKNYILKDFKKEKELGFSLPVSLARARQHPLLQGQSVYITPNIKPDREMIASLVKTVHGEVVNDIKKIRIEDENIPEDLLILTCEEDYKTCVPFLDRGISVYSSELLLSGIVIQKLQYKRHQLFADHVEQRRC